jgi:hypothetical protein
MLFFLTQSKRDRHPMAIAPQMKAAFQAEYGGSIPFTRSNVFKHLPAGKSRRIPNQTEKFVRIPMQSGQGIPI